MVARSAFKLVGKFTTSLYEVIWEESHRLNIYTYEIATYSKSHKIFMTKEFTFEKERHLQKEILVLLQSGQLNNGLIRFIGAIDPLLFKDYNSTTYLRHPIDIRNNPEILDEMEAILEDEPMSKDRSEQLELIGDEYLYFNDDEFDMDEEDI